jgi:hypothetical protein
MQHDEASWRALQDGIRYWERQAYYGAKRR